MSKEHNKYNQTIKFYHILLLSIILSPLIVINSNYVIEKRKKEKLNVEADRKLKKILIGRNLENFEEGMDRICKKGTEELNDYYLSGSLDKLDIDITKKEEEKEENPEYINALLDIVKGYVGGESENELMDNVKTYGMHVLGIVAFLVIAVLSIPGWLICCFCCCCNCCCCCCCKKNSCKCPFFIITTVLYLLVAAVCIFGLIKSKYIFKGIADTECSILKFFNEIIEGETKEEKPKWAGINGIISLIDEAKDTIDEIKNHKWSQLNGQDAIIKQKRRAFETALHTRSHYVIDDNVNKVQINSDDIPSSSPFYRLDITTKRFYGEFTKGNEGADGTLETPNSIDPEDSFIGGWYEEYSAIADNSEREIEEAINNFRTNLIDGDITSSLEDAKTPVNDIRGSIEEISDGVSTNIIEYSDYIDDYGKLGFKLYFTVLVVIDAFLAILMFLLCFCSGKLCNKCCCCRCFFKLFIHILWNILALLMIITFLIGFLFSFIGTVGKDMISVLNYFISSENLGKEEPTLFGESGKKLNSCFNGDGVILENMNGMDSFDQLDDINEEITTYENTFRDLSRNKYAYKEMIKALNERVEYKKCDFSVFSTDNAANPQSYMLSSLITNLNSKITSTNDYWCCSCPCDATPSEKSCKSIKVDTFSYPADSDANKISTKIQKIKSLVHDATILVDDSKSFLESTEKIKGAYEAYLDENTGILSIFRIFRETITELNGVFDEYVGDNGSILDFINCKFIGNNILVILNNIKNCLGGDFYTVGICLLMAGCSMAISICFTILLIIIINVSIDQNKKDDDKQNIRYK